MAVEEGAVHGLLGHNGAGKSTLLRVLFGLVHPDEGRAKLFGREHPYDGTVATLTGVAGFVDRPQFYPYLTARQTLQLLVQADGLGSPVDIEEVLAATGIAYSADRRLRGWSTGVRQRLGLACSLVRRPRLLLPAGKARICTSDDDAAVAIASRFSLKVDWHVRGGLSMRSRAQASCTVSCARWAAKMCLSHSWSRKCRPSPRFFLAHRTRRRTRGSVMTTVSPAIGAPPPEPGPLALPAAPDRAGAATPLATPH